MKVPVWTLLASVVVVQIAYPLTAGGLRAAVVIVTVVLGYLASSVHAWATRGHRATVALGAVAVVGWAVEWIGLRTGFPFGSYGYTDGLGPRLGGVPLVIPLAWAWMAWPAWLAANRLVSARGGVAGRAAAIAVGAVGLASWDLFLDPQMVAEGYWTWSGGEIPLTNYLGWLAVSVVVMAILPRPGPHRTGSQDAPMYAMYLWTYGSSVLAHAVFLGLPESALWGALGMGTVAVPLAVRLWRSR